MDPLRWPWRAIWPVPGGGAGFTRCRRRARRRSLGPAACDTLPLMRPENAGRKWDTVTARPCECGVGVVVEVDGETLNADDVRTLLMGSMAFAVGIRGLEAAVTAATGQTRAVRRVETRRHAMTRRILRDQAIRFLHDKRGIGIRSVAADLNVGRATVARALSPAGRNLTRRDIERLRVDGYAVKSMPLAEVRRILGAEKKVYF